MPSRPLFVASLTAAALAVGLALGGGLGASASEEGRLLPAPAVDTSGGTATAVLAGGCFWGVQGVFQHVDGVTQAVSGYAGGEARSADYRSVSTGQTGHAEAVRVSFDPKRITYGQILQIYFSVAHDPTQLNRQGPDHGTQYRTAIFPADSEQARVAEAYIAQLDRAGAFSKPVVTTVEPKTRFFPAEAYHQDFMAKNPRYPYIVINDAPKVESLKRLFPARYRSEPQLVAAAD